MDVYDPDMFERTERPGALPLASVWALAVASASAIALAWLGGRSLAWFLSIDSWWLHDGFGLCVAGAVALAWLPGWRMARALRVALVLPAVLVVAIVVGWLTWRGLTPGSRYIRIADEAPLVRELPLGMVALAAGALTLAIARAITWGKRGEWLHAWVMLSLVFLLLAGICTPIATQLSGDHQDGWAMAWSELHHVLDRWPVVLGLPLVLATTFTVLAVRCGERVDRRRGELIGEVVTSLLAATALQLANDSWGRSQIYANYVHVLLALALVVAIALLVLGVATWRRGQPARRARTGSTIEGEVACDGDEIVAAYEITSWLRGPRLTCRPFEVITREGPVRVSGDVRVIASLSAVSTRLRVGEAVRVLREGDRVVLSGFVAPPADHPFRASLGRLPGPDAGVARAAETPAGFAGVALALWRPCIAYLIVVTAVALPGLAAALADH